jgi:uncharacterized protein YegL
MPITIKNKLRTNVAILIDSSGSMNGLEKDVIANFNNTLKVLKDKAEENDQDISVSMYTFGGTVDALFVNKPVGQIQELHASDFVADGGTPMLDAIDLSLQNMSKVDAKDTANLITVLTDGEENGSRGISMQQLLNKINVLQGLLKLILRSVCPQFIDVDQLT